MRGEKKFIHSHKHYKLGSPPRARGEAVTSRRKYRKVGITPACAGRSSVAAQTSYFMRDHPRVRGEKENAIETIDEDAGSPPRARGEVCPVATSELCPGITPACAGRRLHKVCRAV